ncbi:hypothetical protein RHMOL_Rhmol01G0124900 [Rhododendron molle]|uniref:Uncharacterized protein n=1 Tax=Rhododendron molle TaxID=49168 RepID=A0ACC0Q0M2_RHOML|nr:hypothetical protein RHMOL_Rhmol01G0124900 [Rhododendron molle]
MGGWNLMTICSSVVRLLCWYGRTLKSDVVILIFSSLSSELAWGAHTVEGPLSSSLCINGA